MDRREFLKTCAALGVTASVPSAVLAGREPAEGGLVEDEFLIGSWGPTFMLPTYAQPDWVVYSGTGVWTVPGDANTLAGAFQLADDAEDRYQRWSTGPIRDGHAGAIRDLEQWRWSSGHAAEGPGG